MGGLVRGEGILTVSRAISTRILHTYFTSVAGSAQSENDRASDKLAQRFRKGEAQRLAATPFQDFIHRQTSLRPTLTWQSTYLYARRLVAPVVGAT